MGTALFPEVFVVVGSGRSGTTFLKNVLKGTLSIEFPPEPKFIARFHSRLPRYGDLASEANIRRLIADIRKTVFFDQLRAWRNYDITVDDVHAGLREPSYRGVLYSILEFVRDQDDCVRLGYKDPHDVVHMPLIADLLPTARFIHIMRDGRDVAASLLGRPYGATNLYSGSRFWARQTAAGRSDGASLGDRYHELRFEDFVLQPESAFPALSRFVLGREDDEIAGLGVAEVKAARRPGAVYRWKEKLSPDQRYLCEAAAGPVLRDCGYDTEFPAARVGGLRAGGFLATDVAKRGVRRILRKLGHAEPTWSPTP